MSDYLDKWIPAFARMTRYFLSFLFGPLGALCVLLIFFSIHSENQIVTVNITGIIDQFVKAEAKKNLPPEVLKVHVKEFGKKLEVTLQEIAKQKHVVLLPSEAVLAGSVDCTKEVMERM